MFGSRVEFSGSADRIALFLVTSNPRWRPAAILENFEWPYLRNGSFDPLCSAHRAVIFAIAQFSCYDRATLIYCITFSKPVYSTLELRIFIHSEDTDECHNFHDVARKLRRDIYGYDFLVVTGYNAYEFLY